MKRTGGVKRLLYVETEDGPHGHEVPATLEEALTRAAGCGGTSVRVVQTAAQSRRKDRRSVFFKTAPRLVRLAYRNRGEAQQFARTRAERRALGIGRTA